MVQREQDDVLGLAAAAAGGRAPAGRRPGRTAFALRPAPGAAPVLRVVLGGRAARSVTGSASSSSGAITCTGVPSTAAKVVRSASCRRTTSLRRAPQGVDIERAAQAHRGRHVVGSAARLELVEEPQPLLGKRQRQRCVARRRHEEAARSGPLLLCARSTCCASRPPWGIQTMPATAIRPRMRARIREITWVASNEWPPSSKKLSVDAHALQAEQLGPDRAQALLGRRAQARHTRWPCRSTSPARAGRRSSLPLA